MRRKVIFDQSLLLMLLYHSSLIEALLVHLHNVLIVLPSLNTLSYLVLPSLPSLLSNHSCVKQCMIRIETGLAGPIPPVL